MKLITSTAIAAALIVALPACERQPAAGGNEAAATEAAGDLSALNGTWKTDIATLKFEQKPDEFALKDGNYSCASCIPPLPTPADGHFHPVADRAYYDRMSVNAVNDKTVEIHRKKGDTEVSSVTMTVSDDGNTLTNKFHDATTPTIRSTAREPKSALARHRPVRMRSPANGSRIKFPNIRRARSATPTRSKATR